MSPQRRISLASLMAFALFACAPVESAPPGRQGPGARPGGGSGYGGSHSGGHYRPGAPGYGHGGNHGYSYPYWGWGLGLAISAPWALGWYDPYWWGPAVYPSYAYRGVYPAYPYNNGCGIDDDCWRALQSQNQPPAPTTEVPPLAAGADGGPTERPLHLNYCDSARAWFPHVRTCPGGWRLIRPEYNPAR